MAKLRADCLLRVEGSAQPRADEGLQRGRCCRPAKKPAQREPPPSHGTPGVYGAQGPLTYTGLAAAGHS